MPRMYKDTDTTRKATIPEMSKQYFGEQQQHDDDSYDWYGDDAWQGDFTGWVEEDLEICCQEYSTKPGEETHAEPCHCCESNEEIETGGAR